MAVAPGEERLDHGGELCVVAARRRQGIEDLRLLFGQARGHATAQAP
ncbi:hypothetical protein ACIOKD_33280 [Streptomyces sp. NPDC087844]